MANRWGKKEMVTDFIFLGSKINADGDCSHEIKTLLRKVHIVKSMVFPVVMYKHNAEKTLQTLLDRKEIKAVNSKGNKS